MTVQMPFGKFRGSLIEELPDEYLRWLLTIEIENVVLAQTIHLEAEARGLFTRRWSRESSHRAPPRHRPPDPALVDELVGTGLRTLAKRHHPDVGGDPARMQALNGAADWIRGQARALA